MRAMATARAGSSSAQEMRAAMEALGSLDGIGSLTMSDHTLVNGPPHAMARPPVDDTLTHAHGEIGPASTPTAPRHNLRVAVIALVAALVFWPTPRAQATAGAVLAAAAPNRPPHLSEAAARMKVNVQVVHNGQHEIRGTIRKEVRGA